MTLVKSLCGLTLTPTILAAHEPECGACQAPITIGHTLRDHDDVTVDMSSRAPHVLAVRPDMGRYSDKSSAPLGRLIQSMSKRNVQVDVLRATAFENHLVTKTTVSGDKVISRFHEQMMAVLEAGLEWGSTTRPVRVLVIDDLRVVIRQLRERAHRKASRRSFRRARDARQWVDPMQLLRDIVLYGGFTGHVLIASTDSTDWLSRDLRDWFGTRLLLGPVQNPAAQIRALFGSSWQREAAIYEETAVSRSTATPWNHGVMTRNGELVDVELSPDPNPFSDPEWW